MVRQDNVVHLHQWVVHVVEGLNLIDVQAGSLNLAALEARHQCVRVHQAAATGVHHDDAVFHLGDRVGIDDVVGLVRQRDVGADHVALDQQIILGGAVLHPQSLHCLPA